MNTISASSLIHFGWDTFKKRPWIFIGALVVVVVASFVIEMVASIFGSDGMGGVVGFIVSFCLSTLVGLGTTSFFLRTENAPEAARIGDLWHPQNYLKYLGAQIILTVVITVGFILLIVPGIIFTLMFVFAQYLIVDKGLGPIEAMKESARITKGEKMNLFVFLLVCLVLNIIGALLLLVGLLVTVPVTMLGLVHAYRLLSARAVAAPSPAATPSPTPTPAV